MSMTCDLHVHSTASDGTVAPGDLPALAKAANVAAIALTDHDTTEGVLACAQACVAEGVDFVAGIEVSADPSAVLEDSDLEGRPHPRYGTLHILGLFVHPADPLLLDLSDRMKKARHERNPAIIARLRELDVDIHYEEVQQLAESCGTQVIGRPHIAQVLVRKGAVASMEEAFTRYIGQSGRAYVRRDRLNPAEAIHAIHHAGGLAILAHPVQLKLDDARLLRRFIGRLQQRGLDGLETRHGDHLPSHTKQFATLASDLGLLVSGGSDYHGLRKPTPLGSQHVPLSVYEHLRRAAASRT